MFSFLAWESGEGKDLISGCIYDTGLEDNYIINVHIPFDNFVVMEKKTLYQSIEWLILIISLAELFFA